MPELPEVEVLRRSLEPRLVGRRIAGVTVATPALREPLDRATLEERLLGREVTALRRRSKYLLIDLVGGPSEPPPSTLVVHLGMSGRLTVVPDDEPPARHEHFSCRLAGGGRLRLVDPRRFGVVLALPTAGLDRDRHFAFLGVEPFAASFDGDHLRRAARGRRGPVKPFLMDARVVVGVGNIYATEALWRAAIHPRRSVGRIGAARWDRLAVAVREVLADAIAQGGTTLADFTDGEGNAGYFQVSLAAYDREGEPCRRCGAPLRRFVQAGRSTYFCPACQR